MIVALALCCSILGLALLFCGLAVAHLNRKLLGARFQIAALGAALHKEEFANRDLRGHLHDQLRKAQATETQVDGVLQKQKYRYQLE